MKIRFSLTEIPFQAIARYQNWRTHLTWREAKFWLRITHWLLRKQGFYERQKSENRT